MSEPSPVPGTAVGIRTLNHLLDAQLMALASEVSDDELFVDPQDGEWNLAQNLAHIGEFPAYFAADLDRWIAAPETTVGRTHDNDVRNAAVDGVGGDRPSGDELRATMGRVFAEMAAVLDKLEDRHLDVPMNNVKYGTEALCDYFGRYVTGHKAAHVDQLRRTIVRVRELGG